jgi:hypothetical protein
MKYGVEPTTSSYLPPGVSDRPTIYDTPASLGIPIFIQPRARRRRELYITTLAAYVRAFKTEVPRNKP